METLALDTGAVIALSRGDQRARALLRAAANDDVVTIVPAPVLAEALRGGPRDAAVHRVLSGRPYAIEIVAVDGDAAQAAGELLGRARLKDATVDALIVATAIRAGASTILTTDITGVRRLAEGRARTVRL